MADEAKIHTAGALKLFDAWHDRLNAHLLSLRKKIACENAGVAIFESIQDFPEIYESIPCVTQIDRVTVDDVFVSFDVRQTRTYHCLPQIETEIKYDYSDSIRIARCWPESVTFPVSFSPHATSVTFRARILHGDKSQWTCFPALGPWTEWTTVERPISDDPRAVAVYDAKHAHQLNGSLCLLVAQYADIYIPWMPQDEYTAENGPFYRKTNEVKMPDVFD